MGVIVEKEEDGGKVFDVGDTVGLIAGVSLGKIGLEVLIAGFWVGFLEGVRVDKDLSCVCTTWSHLTNYCGSNKCILTGQVISTRVTSE